MKQVVESVFFFFFIEEKNVPVFNIQNVTVLNG